MGWDLCCTKQNPLFFLPQERSSTPWCLTSTAWLSTIQWTRFVVRSAWFTKKTRFNAIYPLCPGFRHQCENYWIVSQPKLQDLLIRLNLVFSTEKPYTKTTHRFLPSTPTHHKRRCHMSTAWLSTIKWTRFVVRWAWFMRKTRFNTIYCPACGTSDLGLTASAPLLLWWEFSFYLGFKSS